MMRISKAAFACALTGALVWPAASHAQQVAPAPVPMPTGPSQATYTRYRGREVYWGTLGVGPRFATLYNIPRGTFAMGGGAVIRMHPLSYPSRPASYMPLEFEFDIGYDRYLGENHYELSYGGSFLLHLASGKWQPYILAAAGRSLGQVDAGRDTRWHMGGGFGVGYRTRTFFLGAQVKGGGYVAPGGGPLGAEGIVEAKLVGVVYVF
ncbi:hypothetical protein [Polyangium fumosum]|uniref:Outer membrane protein beta-barrel domain-containing protein n=1 Tax=Polyangium fumosum TaxID=889272 RepID=A0A4U1JDB2_9BACT|nr:hypothetical protein [Polyangium fumosum]TKD08443.1 hypothetical protein E8A74_16150 [Polyangium fumosum]